MVVKNYNHYELFLVRTIIVSVSLKIALTVSSSIKL